MNDISGYHDLALHPGQASIYYQSLTPKRSTISNYYDKEEQEEIKKRRPIQFNDNSHHGIISKVAAKKISRAVDYLCYLVPKRSYYHPGHGRSGQYLLNFITVTLSSDQIHTDNEINRLMLQPFLIELRKKWKVTNYIWRAEKQKNGNMHYHIVTDRFIWWNDLRNYWNYYQQKYGYVARYRLNQVAWHREGFKFRPGQTRCKTYSEQLKAYQEGVRHDWNSPNSTDVHALQTITSVRSYIRKYITKSDDEQAIQGHLWGCSDGLKNLKGARTFAEGSIADELDTLCGSTQTKTYKAKYYSVIYFDPKLLGTLHLVLLISLFNAYLRLTFPAYRPPSLFP